MSTVLADGEKLWLEVTVLVKNDRMTVFDYVCPSGNQTFKGLCPNIIYTPKNMSEM